MKRYVQKSELDAMVVRIMSRVALAASSTRVYRDSTESSSKNFLQRTRRTPLESAWRETSESGVFSVNQRRSRPDRSKDRVFAPPILRVPTFYWNFDCLPFLRYNVRTVECVVHNKCNNVMVGKINGPSGVHHLSIFCQVPRNALVCISVLF